MTQRISQSFTVLLLLTAGSSCAVSMKMHGNRFESPEVYGKTAFRLKGGFPGQANVELTDDYTLRAPTTTNPDTGPTHYPVLGAGLGIKERFEISVDTSFTATAKFQLLGDPKLTAGDGNFSLAVLGSVGGNSTEQSGTGWFSAQSYKVSMDYTTVGAAILAGYRPDKFVNFYFGPFVDHGSYKGNYEVVGVSNTAFDGKGRNRGAILGIELGSPRITGIIEGVWNDLESGNSHHTFWMGGAQAIVTFGAVKPTPAGESRPTDNRSAPSGGIDGRTSF